LRGVEQSVIYDNKGGMKIFRAVLIGATVGIVVCAMLIMLMTIVVLQLKSIPLGALSIITQLIGVLGAFVGSYITVRIAKQNGMVLGIITGLLLFIIIVLVGVTTTAETLTVNTLIKGVAMTIAGCIGGIIAVNKKHRVH